MALVAGGRLRLDEPLVDVLPVVATATDARYARITIGDLLRHTAGWNRDVTFDPIVDRTRTRDELGVLATDTCRPIAIAMLARPLDYDPGTAQVYSNLGYCWLSLVIEARSGDSYEGFVRKTVLAPLGLDAMRIGEAGAPADRLAIHYVRRDGTLRPLPAGPEAEAEMRLLGPAGGWTGTAADYFRFATQPLPPGTTDAPRFIPPGRDYYGLSWRVWPADAGASLTHAGFLPGIFTLVVRSPADFVTVALFNGSPRNDLKAYDDLFGRIRDAAPLRVDQQ
jgi:CubicO group peptidase (beta-lactamase class C family)